MTILDFLRFFEDTFQRHLFITREEVIFTNTVLIDIDSCKKTVDFIAIICTLHAMLYLWVLAYFVCRNVEVSCHLHKVCVRNQQKHRVEYESTVQDTTDIFSLLEETDYRRLLLLQCVIAATVHQSMLFLAALAYFSILLNSVKMDLTVYMVDGLFRLSLLT